MTAILVEYRLVKHAAHYAYDHPGRGHDLAQWTIEVVKRPDYADRIALGMSSDVEYHFGYVLDGQQRWVYTARRPMSDGVCDRCASSSGAASECAGRGHGPRVRAPLDAQCIHCQAKLTARDGQWQAVSK